MHGDRQAPEAIVFMSVFQARGPLEVKKQTFAYMERLSALCSLEAWFLPQDAGYRHNVVSLEDVDNKRLQRSFQLDE